VILRGEIGDQLAEHVRGGGEAVQQQHGRRVRRAGLAIEDVEAVDRDGLVGDLVGGGSRQGDRAESQRAGRQEAMDFDHGGLRVLPFKQLFNGYTGFVTCQ
jgi:hypothetical protein